MRSVDKFANLCINGWAREFVLAVAAGANLIEIGNFDCFYTQGRKFEAEEVWRWLTRRDPASDITLSVTVPHILELDQQVQLAETS